MTDTYASGIVMERPEDNLYEILGLSSTASYFDIFNVFERLKEEDALTADAQYACKALLDTDYRILYNKTQSTKALFDAGFFNDGLDKLVYQYESSKSDFVTTPTHKLQANLEAYQKSGKVARNFAVLVTTGGMAPIHNGHVAMMEQAKRQLEEQGLFVLAGYFAPGHDSYVGQKYGGTAAIPAAHRCAMVELACQDSDWLDCDPWAARYMPGEVNFTSVVGRLGDYLGHQLNMVAPTVFYVYGSDNAGFSAALPNNSVCVERTAISSKLAREGNHDHLDPKVRDYLLSWDQQDTGDLPYLIRNEENEAIKQWDHIVPIEVLEKRRIQLQSTIRLGIAQVFKSLGHKNKVHLMSISDQVTKAKEAVGGRKSISLDPFFSADQRIDSTRYFAVSQAQHSCMYRAQRPGFKTLREQANAIPAGDYVLVEDDTVTGGTIMSALSLLPSNVNIVDQVILSDFGDYAGVEYYDVVDLRDFIVGSAHGGLSVVLGNGLKARVPYAAPYVSLRARAKIPAEAELEISRIIWQANVRFFQGTKLKICDACPSLHSLSEMIGFDPEDTMEAFCQWHVDRLLEPHLV